MAGERRILIVEDDPLWSEIICALLRMRGWSPEVRCSLVGAEQYLRKIGADAILLDLKLPDSDVIKTLDYIPTLRQVHRGPIVILTGWPITPEMEHLAKSAGASALLAKDAPQLQEKVDAVLRT